jgi:hypothetical protein
MSDISITFPPWFGAWFLLGQAAPITTLGVIGLGAALLFGRGARRVGLLRSLKWALAIVGTAWVAGISYWAFVLADQIATDIYQARHHYRLAKTTVMAGIELPQGSSVFVDEAGRLYEIDTKAGATVSIDGALWQGEIRLIPEAARTASDRGIIKSAIPCHRRRHSRDTLPRRKTRRVHRVCRRRSPALHIGAAHGGRRRDRRRRRRHDRRRSRLRGEPGHRVQDFRTPPPRALRACG